MHPVLHACAAVTELSVEDSKAVLSIRTTTSAPVRSVVLFADGLFEGESYVVHCGNDIKSEVSISLVPPRLEPFKVEVKAFVGPPTA